MVLLLGFISTTAMPPSGLFVSEFLIFKSIFDTGHILLLVVVLLLLTMIIWSFGKNIFKILFIPVPDFDEQNIEIIKPWESVSQFLLLATAVYLGLNPPPIFVQLLNDSVSLLPG
jgi:hydrogenase-4 component F